MDRQTDAGQSGPYVPLCFAGDTKKVWLEDRWTDSETMNKRILIFVFLSFCFVTLTNLSTVHALSFVLWHDQSFLTHVVEF